MNASAEDVAALRNPDTVNCESSGGMNRALEIAQHEYEAFNRSKARLIKILVHQREHASMHAMRDRYAKTSGDGKSERKARIACIEQIDNMLAAMLPSLTAREQRMMLCEALEYATATSQETSAHITGKILAIHTGEPALEAIFPASVYFGTRCPELEAKFAGDWPTLIQAWRGRNPRGKKWSVIKAIWEKNVPDHIADWPKEWRDHRAHRACAS